MSAAAARQALDAANNALRNGHDRDADREIARAQALAMIALAEEQRTANLIAAFERDAIQPPHESAAANRPFWNAFSADISERLDIS